MTTDSIGIVCSGGGMKCAYSAGVLDALYHHYGFTMPKVLIGASGSAGNCAYYASGQGYLGKRIWTEHLTNGQMISLRQWPILNIQYLVNTVFRTLQPLDTIAIKQHPTAVLVPLTNSQTGELEYVDITDEHIDVWQTLIAAKSLPLIAGGSHCIDDTCANKYFDGDIAQQLDHHIAHAHRLGCRRVVVIDNQDPHAFTTKLFYRIQAAFGSRAVRVATKRGLSDQVTQEEQDVIYVSPSQDLHTHGLTDDKDKVAVAYELGQRDAMNNAQLQRLFAT